MTAAALPAAPGRTARLPVLVAVVAGALIVGQARVNGRLSAELGAAVPAALVSFSFGTLVVAGYVAVSPRARVALRRRPPHREALRWWYCIGGVGGAMLVAASAAAVPEVGVALVSVGVLAGQTAGGLGVDRVGLAPGGRRPVTLPRVAGALVALVGLGVAAAGQVASVPVGLMALVVAAGVLVAGQQATNGQAQRVTGDARVAALISFTGGTAFLGVLCLVLAAGGALPALTWPSTWWLYVGGLGGATYITLAAAVVRHLGVLRLSLALVAGQLLAAVALDLVVPVPGAGLRVATVVGAVLTLVAVVVAGLPPRGSRPAAPVAAQAPGPAAAERTTPGRPVRTEGGPA